jgi:threonine/homoserine/homoserine lactone efflux protein
MKSYYQGLVTDLFNPKLLLFFFAFLPQFVDTDRSEPWEQMLIIGFYFRSRAFQPTSRWLLLAVASPVALLAAPPWRAFRIGFQARC